MLGCEVTWGELLWLVATWHVMLCHLMCWSCHLVRCAGHVMSLDVLQSTTPVLQSTTPVLQSTTSSTAQGGGGSFKNRKRIGEIDCCE